MINFYTSVCVKIVQFFEQKQNRGGLDRNLKEPGQIQPSLSSKD